jgi:hypothetical protein
MRKWVCWVSSAALIFFGAFGVGVHRDLTLECQNTWSTSGYREWFGILKTRHWKKPSVLENFIRQNYPSDFTNRWRRWHATPPESLLGGPLYCGFRHPPDNGRIVDYYLTGISDPEKKVLYDFFRNADSEAAQNKVNDLLETVFAEK